MIQIVPKKTEPPKRYTDKTLLSAMVSAGKNLEDDELKKFMSEQKIDGIGTVATRASIIEGLIMRKLLERNKKNIISTDMGKTLISSIPVEDVKSAALTAQYEKRLNGIAKGNERPDAFLKDIYTDVTRWCSEIKNAKGIKIMDQNLTDMVCPVCGQALIKYKWGYGCSGHRDGCGFSISSTIAGKELTENQVKDLLAKGEIGPLSGFTSRAGKKFTASLVFEKGDDGKYHVNFKFPPTREAEVPDIYASCPNCGAKMVKGKWGWECESKCGLSVPYTMCDRNIKPEEAESLLAHNDTGILEGFISKKTGRPFSAGLTISGTKVSFYFPDRR